MWRKIARVAGFILAVILIIAYICCASHLAEAHRSEQCVEEVVIEVSNSSPTLHFTTPSAIEEQLAGAGLYAKGEEIDDVDAVKIANYLAKNGFVERADVYTTYSGRLYINIYQHQPLLRLMCRGYNSYITAEGDIFRVPRGSACYLPVVTGNYKPLFSPEFEGGAEECLAEMLKVEEEKVKMLANEYGELNRERVTLVSEIGDLKKSMKKGFFESEKRFDVRKAGIESRLQECNSKLAQVKEQMNEVKGREKPIAERRKKLEREYKIFTNLTNFVARMSRDSFWSAEVVQFVADRNSSGELSLRLIPRSGDFVVEFGTLEGCDEKLEKLRHFYEKGLSQIGWSQYRVVDVRFDKQVICTK